MKNKFISPSSIVLLIGCLIFSCTKKEPPKPTPTPVDPEPLIHVDSVASYRTSTQASGTFPAGIILYYTITSKENLSSISLHESAMTLDSSKTAPTVKDSTGITTFSDPKLYKASYTTEMPSNASHLELKIQAYDVKGETSSLLWGFIPDHY